jgi:tRNA(Ile)-lysidine synthase
LARANAAVEVLADGAERYLALRDRNTSQPGFDAEALVALPEEIRLRLLHRAIDRAGHEGPAELGKVEALLAALDRAVIEGERLKQTLAGALISLADGRIRVEPAPPRRRRAV